MLQQVFSDPTQAVVELVVNSLDAYGHVPKVGRFGMGFFSLLYYVRSPGDSLAVSSVHGRTWVRVEVSRPEDTLKADLEWRGASEGETSGATVDIRSALTEDEVRRMTAHVDRLRYHRGGRVVLNGESVNGREVLPEARRRPRGR